MAAALNDQLASCQPAVCPNNCGWSIKTVLAVKVARASRTCDKLWRSGCSKCTPTERGQKASGRRKRAALIYQEVCIHWEVALPSLWCCLQLAQRTRDQNKFFSEWGYLPTLLAPGIWPSFQNSRYAIRGTIFLCAWQLPPPGRASFKKQIFPSSGCFLLPSTPHGKLHRTLRVHLYSCKRQMERVQITETALFRTQNTNSFSPRLIRSSDIT